MDGSLYSRSRVGGASLSDLTTISEAFRILSLGSNSMRQDIHVERPEIPSIFRRSLKLKVKFRLDYSGKFQAFAHCGGPLCLGASSTSDDR
jgi:hypothetical protein